MTAPDFAFFVSIDGLSNFTDFLGSVGSAGLLECGAGLGSVGSAGLLECGAGLGSVGSAGLLECGAGLFNSCRVKGTKETAKEKETCQKDGFDISPQVMNSCLRQLGSCNVMKISAGQQIGGRAAARHLTFVKFLVYFVRGCGTQVWFPRQPVHLCLRT